MERKHAFLIMAHNDFESLKYLLGALDDKRNDIFLHVDKKTSYADFNEIKSWVKDAGLFFANRLDVRWGHTSFVKCEIELFKLATSKGHYHYYHLLSGVDFPIKSMDYVHDYLSDKDLEYINYHHNGDDGDNFFYKIQFYYPLMKWVERGYYDGPGKKLALLRKIVHYNWWLIDRQRERGIDRTKKYPDMEFVKGDNWCSVTDDFARFVVSKEKQIMKMYRFTNAPDEIYLPTLAYNSQFKDRLANNSLRAIDWKRGNPYEYVYTDLKELTEDTVNLFARKISYVNQPVLVQGLREHIGFKLSKPKSNPLVSVVVPIYNVEAYLQECLDSLSVQTYENIEVLLIDDGSKDSSADIAKTASEKDSRFIYIKQENGGLSAARNTGLDKAKGDYLAVVDSDDWVEPDYIESMLKVALDKNADIVICGLRREDDNPRDITMEGLNCYSKTAAMKILGNIFTDEYMLVIVACNKLFKRSVFEKVRYAKGKIHEDEYAIHRFLDVADLICTVDKTLYHYRIRNDSITGSTRTADLRHFDVLEAHQDRVQCCKRQYYGGFYNLIVYSMFEELLLLMFRYDEDVFKQYHLTSRFRKLLVLECINNYKWLDKHQKKEYGLAILSPIHYKRRVERITNSKKSDA